MTLELSQGAASAAKTVEEVPLNEWRWRLLEVDVALSDFEIGFGASLVHARHKHQLLHLCRSKMRHASQVSEEQKLNTLIIVSTGCSCGV